MHLGKSIAAARRLSAPYRIAEGRNFRLADHDPRDTGPFGRDDKAEASRVEAFVGIEALSELQGRLWSGQQHALLAVFQAMDAAGKDSAIRHVMTGINPQGCVVTPFKAPGPAELRQDYLRRSQAALPARGQIGIFNRSYYEEVLVVRVHPEWLEKQNLPADLADGKHLWKSRYHDIRDFESYLHRNGIAVVKFFLNVSRAEQKKRFLERIEKPAKQWKFSGQDVVERQHWREYMGAYQDAIRATAASHAPWYVVPADQKWFTRLIVTAAMITELAALKPDYPKLTGARRRELKAALTALKRER